MDNYIEDYILESKDKEDNDDGLLSHGIHKKKENPLYTDYKNEQIMKGKAVKSEKGWKKEERRKKFIRNVVGGAAVVGGAMALRHVHKMNNDPEYRANRNAKKEQNKYIDAKHRQNMQIMKKEGKQSANNEKRLRKQERNANYNKAFEDRVKETGGKIHWQNKVRKVFTGHYEESINYLLENFTAEELNTYANYINESADKESYKEYVKSCKAAGVKPKKYREWRKGKFSAKSFLAKAAVAGGIVADIHSRKTTGKGLVERGQDAIYRHRTNKNIRRIERGKRAVNAYGIENTRMHGGFEEALEGITDDDFNNYIDAISTNEDFMRESYRRYCVMMESKGLVPLNEIDFDEIKKSLKGYTKTAVEAVKKEKERKDEEKKLDSERKARKEDEKLSNMTREERIKYLKKKEREKEEKEQDVHDMKQAFKTSLLRGAGEHLGKAAAGILTKPLG